jgi:hypothetical protein
MRMIWSAVAVAALVASVFLFRIVLHGYTDHGHLDVFHLVVALTTAVGGLLMLIRATATWRGRNTA